MSDIAGDDGDPINNVTLSRRDDAGYWLPGVASKGIMPHAPSGYQFYRDVRDFGAKGDGTTDDTAAINRAVAAFSKDNTDKTRCGKECGSTTTLQALVYFPPGTYIVSSPIIQYYHTQFVGNPNNHPVLKGSANFSGIALVDNDPYIPGGNGAEWYINQSNFLRQIRHINFDLTSMKNRNTQGIQRYVPTGIHWQVGQATSISNCFFIMPLGDPSTTAVGIFMENGSGGTMSNLNFLGGNIGMIAGSQQFTATDLTFINCKVGVKQLWNWGFVYKKIVMAGVRIGFDLTEYSDVSKQGVGSISLLDSEFRSTPQPITVGSNAGRRPNLVLDTVSFQRSGPAVSVPGGETLLEGGDTTVKQWVSGYEVLPGEVTGSKRSGTPKPLLEKAGALVDEHGHYFLRNKPSYEKVNNVVVVTDMGVKNDGTGDQTDAINKVLAAKHGGEVVYFPAGIYQVKGTIRVPIGSIIVGSSWSQIQGTGSYFEDENDPKVMVRVGQPGDVGDVEISDMLFTVKGPTAGCILMQWNIRQTINGNGKTAMWDSHFRVGGAEGSDLQYGDCAAKASSVNKKCMAASMMMHMTPGSSGYFENVWLWVADHDLDNPANAEAYETDDGIPRNTKTQVSIYSARGMLIESHGPTWFYGTASEHSQMYQYQLNHAANIFFGHMQTETPYYQPNPTADGPYLPGKFRSDPTFLKCEGGDKLCKTSWALRILNSRQIVIFGGGFYSFFKDNELGCTEKEDCQKSMIETSFSDKLWIYNIFTKGNQEIFTPAGNHFKPLKFDDTVRNGYTSEVAAWLPLALDGAEYGDDDINAGYDGDGDERDAPVCDLSLHFDSLDDLAKANDLDTMCRALLALPLIVGKLDRIWDDYNEVNKGYDETWSYYEKYFRNVVEESIANATRDHDELFQCRELDYPDWQSCKELNAKIYNSRTYEEEYKCLNRPQYEAFLEDNYGVNKTWMVFGNSEHRWKCPKKRGVVSECEDLNRRWKNIPKMADHIEVPNPKSVLTKAGDRLGDVKTQIYATYADMLLSQWGGSYEDAVYVLGLPVGIMEQAVDSMKKDKSIGEEIEEQERKAWIINIITIVFTMLPFAAELLAPIGPIFAFASRIASIIGELGNAALNLRSIILDPKDAVLVLLAWSTGSLAPKFSRTGKGFKEMWTDAGAALKKNGEVFTTFGKFAKENDILLSRVLGRCK